MAPKNKFTRDEMVGAALRVVRAKGIDGLTAKTLADELGTSTQPVFTAFGSMDAVRREVYAAAVRVYDGYTNTGLKEKIPFTFFCPLLFLDKWVVSLPIGVQGASGAGA